MDLEVLEGLGLSKNEATIFVKLLELGETKAGSVISSSGLQSSAVYNAINSLIDKGLVSYIKKGDVKFYKAADPETIVDYIESKKREYMKILPDLKLRTKKDNEEGVEFYKSARGVKTLVFDLIKDAKPGDIYRYFGVKPEYYVLSTEKVYSAEKHIRIEKKLETKAIFSESSRKYTKKTKSSTKRYYRFGMPPNTLIINNKVAIISWEGEPSGILIKSKDIYQTYVDFFESVWEKSKE